MSEANPLRAFRGTLIDFRGDPRRDPNAVRVIADGLLVVLHGNVEAIGPANELLDALGPALAQLGSWEQSVESRATPGGASRASVESQIEELRRAFQPAASS